MKRLIAMDEEDRGINISLGDYSFYLHFTIGQKEISEIQSKMDNLVNYVLDDYDALQDQPKLETVKELYDWFIKNKDFQWIEDVAYDILKPYFGDRHDSEVVKTADDATVAVCNEAANYIISHQ